MTKKKQKQYQKSKHLNIVSLSKQIEKLRDRVEAHHHALLAVTKSYEQHMDRLANIARHDIGNAVQNMFASLALWKDKADKQMIDELDLSLKNLNSTLTNFGQLIPYDVKESFELHQLMVALQVLTRSDTEMNHIDVKFNYNRNDTTKISQSFQPILQMLHNFIL